MAGNADPGMGAVSYTHLFKKIVKTNLDAEEMRQFFEQLEKLSAAHQCNFVISVSSAEGDVPEFIRKYAL